MRLRISESEKAAVRHKFMGFCGNPCCFVRHCLDVHHINEDPSDNHPDNLIPLCTGCHQPLHRKGRVALNYNQLLRYKFLVDECIPGQTISLAKITLDMNRYYNIGDFDNLELICSFLLKWVYFENKTTSQIPLTGKLYAYLGEIAVQRGQASRSLRYLQKAIKLFQALANHYQISHCYGLMALALSQMHQPVIALPTLHYALDAIKQCHGNDNINRFCKGWLHQVEASIHRNASNYGGALSAIMLATDCYSEVMLPIPDREKVQVPFERAKLLISTGCKKDLFMANDILSNVKKTLITTGWCSERSSFHFYQYQLLQTAGETNLAAWQLNIALREAVQAKLDLKISNMLKIISSTKNAGMNICRGLEETLRRLHGDCAICQSKDLHDMAACELRKRGRESLINE